MIRAGVFFILASVPLFADLTGRWSAGGDDVFVLRQEGNAVTGPDRPRGAAAPRAPSCSPCVHRSSPVAAFRQ